MKFFYVIRKHRGALVWVFLLVAAGAFAYAFVTGREYTAFALVEGSAPGKTLSEAQSGVKKDFNTNVRILQSVELAQNAASKLGDADRGRLLAGLTPLFHLGPAPSVAEAIVEGRVITPGASNLNLDVGFRHPDPAVAASVANLLAAEFIRQHDVLAADSEKSATADLQAQADATHKKMDDAQAAMDAITKAYGITNVDPSSGDEFSSTISELNKNVITAKAAVDKLSLEEDQMRDQVGAEKPLLDLPFIGGDQHIVSLIETVNALKDQYQQLLSEGYSIDPPAPILTEAKGRVDSATQQLSDAIKSLAERIDADFRSAENAYELAASRLADMQKKTDEIARQRAKYSSLSAQLASLQKTYSTQQEAISNAELQAKLINVKYTVVAPAEAPPVPDSRNWFAMTMQSLGWGLGGALLAAAGFAIFMPPPVKEREEYERRRRRHRHFHSSARRRS